MTDALEPVCSALGGGVGGTTSQTPPSPTKGMSKGTSPSPVGGEGRGTHSVMRVEHQIIQGNDSALFNLLGVCYILSINWKLIFWIIFFQIIKKCTLYERVHKFHSVASNSSTKSWPYNMRFKYHSTTLRLVNDRISLVIMYRSAFI